jgi:ATP phosphoribosyltransferase
MAENTENKSIGDILDKVKKKPRNSKIHATSFHLGVEDLTNIAEITNAVNELANSKITKTQVVKAMISICKTIDTNKILKKIREQI